MLFPRTCNHSAFVLVNLRFSVLCIIACHFLIFLLVIIAVLLWFTQLLINSKVLYLQFWLFHLFLGIIIAVLLWCTWILINSKVLYLQFWLFHLFLGIIIAVLLWCTWILINSMVLYLQAFFFSTETFWWNRLHQKLEKYKIAIIHSYTPDVTYVKYRHESIRTNGTKVQSENTGMTKNNPCHCNKTNSVDGCKTACTLLST